MTRRSLISRPSTSLMSPTARLRFQSEGNLPCAAQLGPTHIPQALLLERTRSRRPEGNEAFVQCELNPIAGESFRDVEFFLSDGSRIREVIVFFGRGRGTVGDKA